MAAVDHNTGADAEVIALGVEWANLEAWWPAHDDAEDAALDRGDRAEIARLEQDATRHSEVQKAVERQILETRPPSIAGLAVKAMLAKRYAYLQPEDPEPVNFIDDVMRSLIEDIEALAGA